MRRITYLGCAALLTGTLLACRNSDAPIKTTSSGETNISPSAEATNARGTAMVRFVNATTKLPLASLRLDDRLLFDSVQAASVTDYREVNQRMVHLSVRIAGSSDTVSLADENRVLEDGKRYTAFLMTENMAANRLRIVQDDVIPDSGKARIRVMHAAAGAPHVDIRAVNGTDNLLSNVTFANNGDYKDVEPATVSLQVREQGTKTVLLTLPAMDLKRGTATTVVITGSTKLSYFSFTDTMMPTPPAP